MSLATSTGKKDVCAWALCLSPQRDVFTKQATQTETICQEQMWGVGSRGTATINSVPCE